jgi:hypothetical protein
MKIKKKNKIRIKDFLKSYFLDYRNYFLKFKNLIIKLALFSILMKYFRKIKLMRIIIKSINYIFLSTFGIIFTDIYGLTEIIAQIEYY